MPRLIDADALIEEIDCSADIGGILGKVVDEVKLYAKVMAQATPTIKTQKWIPCSERLPDNEKRVLCTVQSGEHFCVVPCIFIQHTRRWLPEVYGNHDNVIAWMPLPRPYRGETSEETDDNH